MTRLSKKEGVFCILIIRSDIVVFMRRLFCLTMTLIVAEEYGALMNSDWGKPK